MKNRTPVIMTLLLVISFFTNCSKTTEITAKPVLLITLKDNTGIPVSGATVRLYKNAADSGITKLSDSTGVVIFYDLDPIIYYWEAAKDCKTNRHSQNTINRALIPGVVLYGYSFLSATGELKITNNAPGPYIISDSRFIDTIKSSSSFTTYHNVGAYTLRSVPVSDSTLIRDTTIQVSCNDTTFINLP
ncbi:MAG: hypothetical protein ABI594_15880, partial [Ginsengibacter sp.]